jgi:NADH-quinone oxidoreductase subunit A
MINSWLILPPVAFAAILLVSILLSEVSKLLAFKDTSAPGGKYKSYACGENVDNPRMQPDYGQFFPFAFFFTIMHVVALVVATVSGSTLKSMGIAALFILCALSCLFILFRKK